MNFISSETSPSKLDSKWLRDICIELGADDVGFVDIERQAITDQRENILAFFPRTKSLICIVTRMHRDSIRTSNRSVGNTEIHRVSTQLKKSTHKIKIALENHGIRSLSESGGFPMNVDGIWPGQMWQVSVKPIAIEAGLGRMGLHRNVLHPKFGVFIYMSVILIDRELTVYDKPINVNPCIDCKLCEVTCPTGAINKDGKFDFFSCITHNYREKLGGFSDWVENIVRSTNVPDYRKRVTDRETVSMWQALTFGGNNKCNYCLSVCPAGSDVVGLYKDNKKSFINEIVKPLQKKKENIYVVHKSDAEAYVIERFPNKTLRRVSNGIRPASIKAFIRYLPLIFQKGQAKGLNAIYHFTFTGAEEENFTVMINHGELEIKEGLVETPNLKITADSRTWLDFLAKETKIVWALIRFKIRIRGDPRLLLAFGKCFPS